MTAPPSRDSVLAIDIGTSQLKTAIIDARGRLLWHARHTQAISSPHPDWVEQDADQWWRLLCSLLRRADRELLARVAGVAVTGHSPTLVCVGRDGSVRRPALTWADRRAVVEARELADRTGRLVDAAMLVPKSAWLARHEPHVLQDAVLLQALDFVAYRLTGEICAISAVPGWSAWDPAQIDAAGLAAALIPRPGPPIGTAIAPLSASAAEATGLPPGCPVVAALADGPAAWIGTGTLQAGQLYAGAGTSAGANLCWGTRLECPERRISALPHPFGGRYMPGGPMSSGARFLDWLATSVCHVDIATLADEASSVVPGAEGLLALPYLAGERTPIGDPHARAVFLGLGAQHTRAHLARAAMEAVAFAIRDVMDVLIGAGGKVDTVHLGGGASASDTWNQIKADVLERPVVVPAVADASLMGAAVVAAWGAGLHPSGDDAARAMVQRARIYEPRPSTVYRELFDLFRKTYDALRPEFPILQRVAAAV